MLNGSLNILINLIHIIKISTYLNILIKMNFSTKKNNGTRTIETNGKTMFYTNQCMWISIIDYLHDVLKCDIELDAIREIGSEANAPINGINEQFDAELHIESLSNVATIIKLQINIHAAHEENGKFVISEKPSWTVGDKCSPHTVAIVSFGEHFESFTINGHFELITSIKGIKLYEKDDSTDMHCVYPFHDDEMTQHDALCEQKRVAEDTTKLLHEQINELTHQLTLNELKLKDLQETKNDIENTLDDNLIATIDNDIITIKNSIIQLQTTLDVGKENLIIEQEKLKSIEISFLKLFI